MRKAIYILLSLILTLLLSEDLLAGSKSALLSVSASVIPYAKHNVLHQENSLTITERDIERGYKEISNATVLSVKTNSLDGYMMFFPTAGDFFREVTLLEGNIAYNLSESNQEVFFAQHGKSFMTKELSFRFTLSADTKPGTYQWPLAYMINPM